MARRNRRNLVTTGNIKISFLVQDRSSFGKNEYVFEDVSNIMSKVDLMDLLNISKFYLHIENIPSFQVYEEHKCISLL